MQMIPSNDYGHANSGLAKKMGKYDMVVQPNVVMKDEYCMNYIATTAENYDISYVVFITAFVNICGIKLKVNFFFFYLIFFLSKKYSSSFIIPDGLDNSEWKSRTYKLCAD